MSMIRFNLWQYIGGSITGILAFLAPMKVTFIVMFIVILCDLITGIWASKVKNIHISSRRLRKSVAKVLMYFQVIFLLFIIEYGIFNDLGINIWRFIAGFICFVELFSIAENATIITGNKIFIKIVTLLSKKTSEQYGEVIDEIIKEKNE